MAIYSNDVQKMKKYHSPRQYMFFRNAVEPRITHDARYVLFLCDVSGVPQVWLLDLENDHLEQATFHVERVGDIRPHPNDDSFIYTLDVGGNERFQLFFAENHGEYDMKLTDASNAIHRLGHFSPNGKWFTHASNSREIQHFDLHVLDMDKMEIDFTINREGTWIPQSFSRDGNYFLALEYKSNLDQRLALINVKKQTIHSLEWETPQEEAIIRNPTFLDDKNLLLITNHGRDLKALARTVIKDDYTLSDPEYLHSPSFEVESFQISKNLQRLSLEVNEHGYSRLKAFEFPTMDPLPEPRLPNGVLKGADISPDGGFVVLSWSRPNYPPNLWQWNLESGQCRALTDFGTARIPPENLVEPQLITIRSFDGLQMEAFLYIPISNSPPYPCIISIHGGPESQARPEMRPVYQYFVNLGYAVLVPNVRGSTGYGKRFTHLDDKRLRMDAVKDIKAFVDHLKQYHSDQVDVNELILHGGSYGGFMVLACLYSFPDVFKAGIEIVGIVSFRTFLERTGKWRRHLREVEYGSLEEDGEFLDQISPLSNVNRIRAPLMVIHGKNDPRVPYHEAEQLVDALRQRKKLVKLLTFDDEGHGIVKIHNKVIMLAEIHEFLQSLVK